MCHRPVHGERILLLTNRTDLTQVLGLYGQRWTDTTFAYLKSEDLNSVPIGPKRLHLLLGLLAWICARCWWANSYLRETHPDSKTSRAIEVESED